MANKLTATTLRNMKKPAEGKRFTRAYDGDGLFAYYLRKGTRPWKLRYSDAAGKERWLTLGEYPAMTLEQARAAANDTRNKLIQGIDPKLEMQKAAELPNFIEASGLWLAHASSNWRSDHTREIAQAWIDQDLAKAFGSMPLSSVEAGHIVNLLRKVEAEGHDYKLRRLYGYIKRIFSFSISHGWCKHNPAVEIGFIRKSGA